MDVMTFKTIDSYVQMSRELDFCLITTSKITLVEFKYPGQQPKFS